MPMHGLRQAGEGGNHLARYIPLPLRTLYSFFFSLYSLHTSLIASFICLTLILVRDQFHSFLDIPFPSLFQAV